jgi:hypothetical protein
MLAGAKLPDTSRLGERYAAPAALLGALILAAVAAHLGVDGLALVLALVGCVVALLSPTAALAGVGFLVIMCEGSEFGIASFTGRLYEQLFHDITPLDALVGLAVVSSLLAALRDERPIRIPRALLIPSVMLALGMADGIWVGHADGTALRFSVFSEHVLAYMLLLPIAVANLGIDERTVRRLLAGAYGLAIIKAIIGLIEISLHLGKPLEGTTTLTYYEPAANWVIMMALLGLLAMAIVGPRPPLWMLLGSPLLFMCLLLSYRRSFWIATLLAAVLIVLFATSPQTRRLLVPTALLMAFSVWLLANTGFQSNLPIVKRIDSISASKLEANREDRYRIDERANVIAEIERHPLTGIGSGGTWQATAAPLPVEHEEGRSYAHFALLLYWLKLGVLGLAAYISLILGSALLAWRAWRSAQDSWMRAFGLASACAVAGLAVMDTTASFTGVEARFTVIFAIQLGLLALLAAHHPAELGEPA